VRKIGLAIRPQLPRHVGLICSLLLAVGCGSDPAPAPSLPDAGPVSDAASNAAALDGAATNPQPGAPDAAGATDATFTVPGGKTDALADATMPPAAADAASDAPPADATPPPLTGAAAFIGSWKYSGTKVFECQTDPKPEMDTGTLQVRAGTDAPIVVMRQCPVKHDINGDVATLRPGQTCSYTAAGYAVSVNYMTSTLTLNGDGTIKWKEAWSGKIDTVNCTQTMDATLTR
jgi:hypothetical protein